MDWPSAWIVPYKPSGKKEPWARISPGYGCALRMDGPNGNSGWMGARHGRVIGMVGPPWVLGIDWPIGPRAGWVLGRDGSRDGLALGKDGPPAWMGSHVPSGWMCPGQGWALWMNGPAWALGIDGSWAGMGPQHGWVLGMDGPPKVLGMDEPWAGWAFGRDGPRESITRHG